MPPIQDPDADNQQISDAKSAADPSAAANQDANNGAGSSPEPDAKTAADSSTAGEKGDAKPASLLDVLRDVVEDKAPESSTEGKTGTDQDGGKASGNKDSKKDGEPKAGEKNADGNDSDLPFHNHPRFKAVLAERDALRSGATEYGKIQQFMDTNNLTTEEVANGYQIMAALKNDPQQALKMLAPIYEMLRQFTGETLAPDLQAKVDNGELEEEAAKLIARERANGNAELARLRASQEAQQRQQHSSQEQALQQQQMAIGQAVTEWETSIKSRDADYAVKQAFVADKVLALMAEGSPKTPEEAVAIAQKAYDEVTKSLGAIVPRKAPTKVSTSQNSSANNAQPQPKSFKEAIALAANGE